MNAVVLSPVRAACSVILFENAGPHLFSIAFMMFVLHIAVGDAWDRSFSSERRLGASVVGALALLISGLLTAAAYGSVLPLAGQVLLFPLLWFVALFVLCMNTWSMNNEGGKIPSYPYPGEAQTKFFVTS